MHNLNDTVWESNPVNVFADKQKVQAAASTVQRLLAAAPEWVPDNQPPATGLLNMCEPLLLMDSVTSSCTATMSKSLDSYLKAHAAYCTQATEDPHEPKDLIVFSRVQPPHCLFGFILAYQQLTHNICMNSCFTTAIHAYSMINMFH